MHHAKAEINRAISQRQHYFMSTNKMAEIVDSEATPVDTFVPEARLDDNDRRKLIAFYKEKPILWDTSLKLSKKAAKEQKETALKDLEEHIRPREAFQLHIRRASRSMEKSEGMYAERGQENWKRYSIISVEVMTLNLCFYSLE